MMGLQRRFFVLAAASVAVLGSTAAPAGAADLVKSGTELQYSSEGTELYGLTRRSAATSSRSTATIR